MKYLMKCGHVANAIDENGKPVCAFCAPDVKGVTVERAIESETGGLEGRKARCAWCSRVTESRWTLPFSSIVPIRKRTATIAVAEVGTDMSFCSDVYAIDKFIELVELGTITDYDGYGYYSFDGEEELELVPINGNKIYKTSAKKGYKYIIWYNR